MKKILIKAAKEAGKLLLDNFQTERASKIIQKKGKFDYATLMDKMAEDKILEILKENDIKGKIVSEEIGTVNLGESDYEFFIDPLDGTINYSSGISIFCTSIGVKKGNDIKFGVVYYPDKKELFVAERGKGAFLNNKKLHVNSKSDLATCMFDFTLDVDQPEITIKTLKKIIEVIHFRQLYSATLATCFIAANRVDGLVYVWSSPIDLLASVLIVEEAGGKVTDFNGKRWDEHSGNIVATNPILHEKMIKLLRD